MKVKVRPNLGTREIVIPALKAGDIDLLPEYQGALLNYLDPEGRLRPSRATCRTPSPSRCPGGLQVLPYGGGRGLRRASSSPGRPHGSTA